MSKDKFSTLEIYIFILLASLLIGLRFYHLGPYIDDPHSWRQCDTAHYIYDFYENGVDLLHPQVCWMGNYGVTALEFPLPEAIVAWAYRLFGPHHEVARLVFLLFFLASAFYLGKIIAYLFDQRLAYLSILIYLALPLSLYYSRAIHVDFSTLMFGLAGLYYLLKGLDHPKWSYWLASSCLFSLAFLVKAPTVFAFGPAAAVLMLRHPHFRKRIPFFPLLLIPVILFVLWRQHAEHINGAAPDWSFIPGYHPMINMGGWYYGTWAQRMSAQIWSMQLSRLSLELAGISGLLLMAGGWIVNRKNKLFVWMWLLGVVLYYLIFFNLNIQHDYYQIPFLPFIALSIALFVQYCHTRWGLAISLTLLALVIGENVVRSEWTKYPHTGTFYEVNMLYVEAGKHIQENTDPNEFLILAGRHQDPRSPFLMYRARRKGWPMNISAITPDIIQKLRIEGASQLVMLYPVNTTLSPEMQAFVDAHEIKPFSVPGRHGGEWKLQIMKLD